jgi:chemotaxis protein MotB
MSAPAEELEHECECDPGAPQWMATFADLSTLLMSFFVLLLAFSEMDVAKFKQLSGSMKNAFGVQSDVEVKTMPKGTSIIAREFRPGRPDPTPLETVRQYTIHTNKSSLKWLENQGDAFKDIIKVFEQLQGDIERQDLSVEWNKDSITIHIRERASFDSSSADLKTDFLPVLGRVRGLLAELPGDVKVEGHTDDIPIATARFRSDWELSASRAVSVAHELLEGDTLDPERFVIVGHADTVPVESNDTAEGRAANRRVDVIIDRENASDGDDPAALAGQLGAVLGKIEGGVVQLTLPETIEAGDTGESAGGDAASAPERAPAAGPDTLIAPIDRDAVVPDLRVTPPAERIERENEPVAPLPATARPIYDDEI